MKTPDSPEGKPSAATSAFYTENFRHLRALAALLVRSQTREALDRAVGCSNGPDLVAQLRRKGLAIPCTMIPDTDRDGLPIRRGVYYLTDKDRRIVRAMTGRKAAHHG